MITPGEVGVTYMSKGLIFVVIGFFVNRWQESVARCLVLDSHSSFSDFIEPGTLMEVEFYSSIWSDAMWIASSRENDKVSP